MVDSSTVSYLSTVTDPVFFTEPWTFKRVFHRAIGDRIMSTRAQRRKDLEYRASAGGRAGVSGCPAWRARSRGPLVHR
jgi:hypothetical protein